ncbi:Crp/Fnr family transcriptional regulator [Solirubrobacter phytolaccae]|uniref:Crp/Fnr family transcriptional regulator n=1 Tax=Solirubrobacter phytolaccae TaxID=1404360 RepID=A0A9X3N4D1_9ACTN|nr:Crp/Fnr family transcriptional regulator [Solirubrobacter phytolaccae]MDA0179513.1 Crp/Fnr family transcriptional regulator [Solirubrobacter phytolaccae]
MTADFWAGLEPAAREALRKRGQSCTYARGRELLHEGQVPDRVLLLRSGLVKVSRVVLGGREVVLAYRGPGELVGEQSALDGEPRSATVAAVEAVDAFVFTHSAFRGFLREHPEAALVLLALMSQRLREADSRRAEFSTLSTMGRVASRLAELCDRFGDEHDGRIRISLPITQDELAGSTGASIESVGRALQTMRSLKYIETKRREIQVLDREALDALRNA